MLFSALLQCSQILSRADDAESFLLAKAARQAMSGRLYRLLSLTLVSVHCVQGCIHDLLSSKISSGHQSYITRDQLTFSEHLSSRRLGEQPFIVGDTTSYQAYDRAAGEAVARDLFQPIRITPYYDNSTLDLLSPDQREVLLRIIPDAINEFSRSLQVVPVHGNLTAQHSCDVQWVTSPIVCKSLVEQEMCFEMEIPAEHFGATRSCSTCLTTGCAVGDCTKTPSQGIPDTDFMLYVRAAETEYCAGQVLAYATSCQKDQFDRPTFGMANFCPSQLNTDPKSYATQVSTALHEITHALGFSAQYFAYMRHPDGTPRTPRDQNGNPISANDHECPNLGQSANGSDIVGSYAVPSTSTVAYYDERDHVVAKLVTPAVAAFVQMHFNCSTLTGAELESQDTGCVGSHWEERLFEPEYMSPVSSFRNVLSGLTLAFFEDSGWYKANYSRAQSLFFGQNRGCAFATEKCIDPSTAKSIASDHYCVDNTAESCSLDATSRSTCSLSTGKSDIPAAYRYFLDDPSKGGDNEFADFCPLNVGYSLGDCTIPDNLATAPGTSINILGETYCPACRCTATSLRSSDSTDWIVNARRQTGCYAMRCLHANATVGVSSNETVVELTVARSQTGDAITVLCSARGEQVNVPGFSGTITCPDPEVICSMGMTEEFASAVTTRASSIEAVASKEAANALRGTSSASAHSTLIFTAGWALIVAMNLI